MRTLKDYITVGQLPLLAEKEYKDICSSLGFTIENVDSSIDEEQYTRLQNDPKIASALLEQKAFKLNHDYGVSYNQLLAEAQETLDKAEANGLVDEARPMRDVVSKLTGERNVHGERELDIVSGRDNTLLDGILNESQMDKVSKLNFNIEQNDEALKEAYANKDDLNKTLEASRTFFKKQRTKRRLKKVEKTISKLRNKQGKLMGEQSRIVNAAIEKYKKIKETQMREYSKIIASNKEYVESVDKINTSLKDIDNDINLTNKELNDSSLDKFQRKDLEKDAKKLEKEKESLLAEKNRIDKMRKLQTRLKNLRNKTRVLGNGVQMPTMTPALMP